MLRGIDGMVSNGMSKLEKEGGILRRERVAAVRMWVRVFVTGVGVVTGAGARL